MASIHTEFKFGAQRPPLVGKVAMLAVASGAAVSVILAPDADGAMGASLALLMGAIAFVDVRSYIIPDELTIAGVALALVQAALHGGEAIAASVAFAALRGMVLAALFWSLRIAYRRLRGRDGLGFGDVKLAGVAGAWLGWTTMPVAIEIAALSGIVVYAVRQYLFGRPVRPNGRLPFGAFFAPAIWLAWVFETAFLSKF